MSKALKASTGSQGSLEQDGFETHEQERASAENTPYPINTMK